MRDHGVSGLRRHRVLYPVGVAMLAIGSLRAEAFEIDTHSELQLRLDARVAYVGATRLSERGEQVITDINRDINRNDGNRNFDRGLVSNRLKVEPEFLARYGLFTARINGVGLYDEVYLKTNDNDSPDTSNTVPFNEFSRGTRDVMGKRAELQDAYVMGAVEFLGRPVDFTIGRFPLIWGRALLDPLNGIAATMVPFDAANATKDPTEFNITANKVTLPLLQATAEIPLSPDLSLSGYYQFEWRKSRLPAAGAYLSSTDFFDDGGERLLVRSGNPLLDSLANYHAVRVSDINPPDKGQGGLSLLWSFPDDWIDGAIGLYALQFHSREPSGYVRLEPSSLQPLVQADLPIIGNLPIISDVDLNIPVGNTDLLTILGALESAILNDGRVGEYAVMYGGTKARLYGASIQTEFHSFLGQTRIAGEASYRRGVPLVSEIIFTTTPLNQLSADKPLHAIGDTAHAQVSIIALPGAPYLWGQKLWDRGILLGELSWQERVKVTMNPEQLDAGKSRSAMVTRLQFTPTWRRFLTDSMDLSMPIGVTHTVRGNSSVMLGYDDGGDNTGEARLGLRLTIGKRYTVGLLYAHFYGDPREQVYARRDYLSWGLAAEF